MPNNPTPLTLEAMAWQPIETLPELTDALVCVTHNIQGDHGDEWETVMWVDGYSERHGWFAFPQLVHVPFPPTHWMPLPSPPTIDEREGE
jgi:hypothetical protein